MNTTFPGEPFVQTDLFTVMLFGVEVNYSEVSSYPCLIQKGLLWHIPIISLLETL